MASTMKSPCAKVKKPKEDPTWARSLKKTHIVEGQSVIDGDAIRIITKDFIRTLRVPPKEPHKNIITLEPEKFGDMTCMTRVLTKEERQALKKAFERDKEEKMRISEHKKGEIKEADMAMKKNQPLNDLEQEAQERSRCILERATALKMEQEDEIKHLNQVILGAQVKATVDTQIEEKKQFKSEMAGEERRLDIMMEVDRLKAVENLRKLDDMRKEERMRGRKEICKQIDKNLEEKQIQEEMKEREKELLRQEIQRRNLEDQQNLEKKRMEQKLLQEEIMRINSEAMMAKERRIEEERQANLRALEYMKQKMEREEEQEAEQKRLKKEKEIELAKLLARQERARDYKAEQDEIRARRNQEIDERKWRQKEKELAEHKASVAAMLREARLEQVQNKERCLAMEAGREKALFDRVLKAQREDMAKEKEDEERHRERASQHTQALRQQVRERELSAAAKRQDMMNEATRQMEAAKQRQMQLYEIKDQKLKELRAVGLPEKYVVEVERKSQKVLTPAR